MTIVSNPIQKGGFIHVRLLVVNARRITLIQKIKMKQNDIEWSVIELFKITRVLTNMQEKKNVNYMQL